MRDWDDDDELRDPAYRRALKESIDKTRRQLGEPPKDWTDFDAETERLERERRRTVVRDLPPAVASASAYACADADYERRERAGLDPVGPAYRSACGRAPIEILDGVETPCQDCEFVGWEYVRAEKKWRQARAEREARLAAMPWWRRAWVRLSGAADEDRHA